MNIRLFNKKYWIRHFEEQKEIRGYFTSGYSDFVADINIHPMGEDNINALPEGERRIKHLEGHGEVPLVTANQDENRKGDMVFYHGYWYECTSSQLWDHTVLSHYNYKFVIIPNDSAGSYELGEPDGDPYKWKGGDNG